MSESTDRADAVFLPFPPAPDRDSAPYWQGLADGELRLQRCIDCGALRWPARALCNRCRSFECRWEAQVDPGAHIVSWVRTHQVFAPALREAVPYTVVQVALETQPDLLLIGGWSGARAPRAGESVELFIAEGPDGHHLPCWRPRGEPGGSS